jgi:hypothetical protein
MLEVRLFMDVRRAMEIIPPSEDSRATAHDDVK